MDAVGKKGEDAAALWLAGKGQTVLERNWRGGRCEIDLITADGNGLHFVEVKTRTGSEYGTPGAAVTYTKQQKLRKTALVWLQEQEQYYSDLCFDVIEVWVVGKTAKIRWLQSCF